MIEHEIQLSELSERPTEAAHSLVRNHVKPGDQVVDATIGNGHDTIFLAEWVGPSGHVDGFDIQNEAIDSTHQKLRDHSIKHVTLHQLGHETMDSIVEAPVKAVMFNLGYLPGENKELITLAHTTLTALQKSVELLALDGIVTLVVYTGHPGGQEESEAVHAFCRSLNPEQHTTTIFKSASAKASAPFLISIVRL
jgi:hypothetical protein